jgi:hypothetical protein
VVLTYCIDTLTDGTQLLLLWMVPAGIQLPASQLIINIVQADYSTRVVIIDAAGTQTLVVLHSD